VRLDPLGIAVEDGPEAEVTLQGPEGFLDMAELHIAVRGRPKGTS
jgi:hypothetical protein